VFILLRWGCVMFTAGANFFVRCWYSGCSFIVHGMKYIQHRFLCVDGCSVSISGIGPRLVSMSPHKCRSRCSGNLLIGKFLWSGGCSSRT